MKKGQRRTDNKKAGKQRRHPRRHYVSPAGIRDGKRKKTAIPPLFGHLGSDDYLLGSLILTGLNILLGGPAGIGRIFRNVSNNIPHDEHCLCHSTCLLSTTPAKTCKGQNPSGCANCTCYGLRSEPCICDGKCLCHSGVQLAGIPCPADCPNQGKRFDGCHRCDCTPARPK